MENRRDGARVGKGLYIYIYMSICILIIGRSVRERVIENVLIIEK